MSSEQWQLAFRLFCETVDLSAQERETFLQEAARQDVAINRVVLAAVVQMWADDASPSVLDGGLAALAAELSPEAFEAPMPEHIGDYLVEERLGQGGMGVVYRAQHQTVGNVVAIKLLRGSPFASADQERFLKEQKMLAQLNHRSIAHFYHCGTYREADPTLESEVPYFVMEYVPGESLTQYCQSNRLTIRKRLQLFLEVCQAVQYAHSHMILHRDLKPSNIRIREDGTLRLLDFGIARSMAEVGTTPFQAREPVSLGYAPPEQVAGGPLSWQSDVYALGATLYELLTDRKTFALSSCPDTESVHRTLQRDTLPPSHSPAPSLPARDKISRRDWQELDLICAKAMQKDISERYGSVEALATDINRFLQMQPLSARQPQTASYRTAKFLQRNRRAVSLSAATVAVFIGLVTFYTDRLRISRNEALQQTQRAQKVQAFVIGLFKGFDPDRERVPRETALAILERGEREARALQNQPLMQADLFHTLASGFENLGSFDRAEKLYQGALALRERLFGRETPSTVDELLGWGRVEEAQSRFDSAEKITRKALAVALAEQPKSMTQIAKAEVELANVLTDRGKNRDAVPLFQEALQRAQQGTPDLDLQEHSEIGLANTAINLDHLAEARRHNQEALRLARQLKGNEHPDVASNLLTGNEYDVLAGQYEEAERKAREAWRIQENWLGPENPQTIDAQRVLAQNLGLLGRNGEAETLLQQALQAEEQARPEPHKELALLMNALGQIQAHQNEWEAGEASYAKALAIYRAVYHGKDYKIGVTLDNLAALRFRRKQWGRAEEASHAAVAMFCETLPTGHTRVAFAEARLGQILAAEHRYPEAAGWLLSSYEKLQRQNPPPADSLENLRYNLHEVYIRWGHPEKARLFAEPAKP